MHFKKTFSAKESPNKALSAIQVWVCKNIESVPFVITRNRESFFLRFFNSLSIEYYDIYGVQKHAKATASPASQVPDIRLCR